MNIESTKPGFVWSFYLAQSSTPKSILATECKIEQGEQGVVWTVTQWDARRVRQYLTGKATAKSKNIAYSELLASMLASGYISQAAFDSAPKTFS